MTDCSFIGRHLNVVRGDSTDKIFITDQDDKYVYLNNGRRYKITEIYKKGKGLFVNVTVNTEKTQQKEKTMNVKVGSAVYVGATKSTLGSMKKVTEVSADKKKVKIGAVWHSVSAIKKDHYATLYIGIAPTYNEDVEEEEEEEQETSFAREEVEEPDEEEEEQEEEEPEEEEEQEEEEPEEEEEELPVTGGEIRGRPVMYKGKSFVVEKTTTTTGTIPPGTFSLQDVVRSGTARRPVWTVPRLLSKPAEKEKRSALPDPVKQMSARRVKKIEHFTQDIAQDVAEILTEDVAALFQDYAAGLQFGPAMALLDPRKGDCVTLCFSIFAPSVDDDRIQEILNKQRAEIKAKSLSLDELEEADYKEPTPAPAQIDESELQGDDDIEMEEEDDDVLLEEEEEDDIPTEPAETSFPEDVTELVEAGAARNGSLTGKKFQKLVTAWYESQDVYDAVGYDIEPGMEVMVGDKSYVLVGLKDDAPVLLSEKGLAKAGVTLELLQQYIAE